MSLGQLRNGSVLYRLCCRRSRLDLSRFRLRYGMGNVVGRTVDSVFAQDNFGSGRTEDTIASLIEDAIGCTSCEGDQGRGREQTHSYKT